MVLLREGRYATAPTPIPSGGAYKKPLEARAPTINRVIEIAGLALATLALTFVILMVAAHFKLSQPEPEDLIYKGAPSASGR
jgi:hypothetical protein